jgi:hypothetical protein
MLAQMAINGYNCSMIKRKSPVYLLVFFLLVLTCQAFSAQISKAEFDRLVLVDKLLLGQIGEMEAEFENSPALKKYRVEYLATVASKQIKPVSTQEMIKNIDAARFVFLGDEHTTAESQLNTIKILGLMRKNKAPVTLVLEWIDESHQADIDAFLAGKLPLKNLRGKIAFDKDWGFSWTSFGKILSAAKKMKVPILLVERLKKRYSLGDRDTHIAGKIKLNADKNKEMRFLTVYGEYHLLGPDHLTEKCAQLGLKSQLIMVGDAPGVYWKLLGRTMDPDKVEFAHLKNNVFYIRNGTPVERSFSYRSYLMKVLGWSQDDFDEKITRADITAKAAAQANFDRLHQQR